MANIPEQSRPTIDAIYAHYKDANGDGFRSHLGASVIGRPCLREIWYGYRWTLSRIFEGRILRLFDHGNVEEKRVIKDLRGIGCEVFTRDPRTKWQFGFLEFEGHFAGSCDGIVLGLPEAPKTPHLLEVKTANDRIFKLLETNGVQKEKPEHFAQMQIYMNFAKLKRAVYITVNKNTDQIYLERINFEPKVAEKYLNRAFRIITAKRIPDKLSDNPSHWECKYCTYYDICHQKGIPEKNCRTCEHSRPKVNVGDDISAKLKPVWICAPELKIIKKTVMKKGCRNYNLRDGMKPSFSKEDMNRFQQSRNFPPTTVLENSSKKPPWAK